MNNENVLFKEKQLDELITNFQNRINDINNRFEEIKAKTSVLDGNPEVWVSRSQQAFKNKKDGYVKYFDVVLTELTEQLNILKLAKLKFQEAETNISKGVDYFIEEA